MNGSVSDVRKDVDGSTRLMGLIGSSIKHTLSPAIHNFSAQILNKNVIYLPLDFHTKFPCKQFFDEMWNANAVGFNVTVPFKEEAAALFSGSGNSKKSVNTIYRQDGGWTACSTDGKGFIRGLNQITSRIEAFEAIIFMGNGGSALALSETFGELFEEIPQLVLRRSTARDSLWVHARLFEFSPSSLVGLLERYPKSLLIQCTSAPLRGDGLEQFADVLNFFPGVFVDLIYGSPSAILLKAQSLGIVCQDGLSMLIGQALLSQEIWWGEAADFRDVEEYLRKKFSKLTSNRAITPDSLG